MFDNLIKTVSKPNKRSRKSGVEIPRTVSFLQALLANKVDGKSAPIRISYAALATAAEALGEHEATNMSAGQRGSALLSGVPGSLQPRVCNAKGGYSKGIEWDDAPDADVKSLRKEAYLRPENVGPFVQAFIAATTPAEESTETVAPEATQEGDDSSE